MIRTNKSYVNGKHYKSQFFFFFFKSQFCMPMVEKKKKKKKKIKNKKKKKEKKKKWKKEIFDCYHIMGEFGAYTGNFPDVDTAAMTVENLQIQSCSYDFSGIFFIFYLFFY